jgi:lipopolysaccharide transport system ATP-binding protein
MSEIVITAENLSKSYLVGHQSAQRETYATARDAIAREARNFSRKTLDFVRGRQIMQGDEIEEFWALRDVSFEVKRGEVLGIIGRNGAGKSTLLKILSRITEPDRGRVTLRGRVASLLEVGTGFHPELTGRENIFLNGAILGMTRAEIKSKFDEMVAFAEVERFLDTPVKRYSSGMHVRLGFAVAAHLEPEILVVDEVLAVGDAEFQKKCLGKMRSVATRENRTVLFVSHNLQAVQSLCGRAILLDAGRIAAQGATGPLVARYLAQDRPFNGERVWSQNSAPGDTDVKMTAVRVLSPDGHPSGALSSKHDVCVELDFVARVANARLCIGFDLANSEGITVLRTYQTDRPLECWLPVKKGHNRWRCTIPKGLLNAGDFFINPRISIHNVSWIVHEDAVLQFRVVLTHGISPVWPGRPGVIAPILCWESVID